MKYFEEYKGNRHADELVAGLEDVMLENVQVTGEAERGTILCSDNAGVYSAVSVAADAGKALAIAYEDFDAGTDATVATVYTSGKFHANKLKTGGEVDVEDFKESLRRDNILLTTLQF